MRIDLALQSIPFIGSFPVLLLFCFVLFSLLFSSWNGLSKVWVFHRITLNDAPINIQQPVNKVSIYSNKNESLEVTHSSANSVKILQEPPRYHELSNLLGIQRRTKRVKNHSILQVFILWINVIVRASMEWENSH